MKLELPNEVFLYAEPVNLHFSFDRLAGIVRAELGREPRESSLFLFYNRRRTHMKLLWHDRSGYWIGYKRLDRGTYRIPSVVTPHARSVSVSERELRVMLEGVDLSLIRAAKRRNRRQVEASSTTSQGRAANLT